MRTASSSAGWPATTTSTTLTGTKSTPDAASPGPGSAARSAETLEIGVRGGAVQLDRRGSGTPLVLLHGWALDRRIWTPQIEALARDYQVIALDRRGFGRSTAPPDLGAEVDDLLVLKKKLGLDRMILVGMSQAGRVALQFALVHPDSVCGIVLQGAPLDGFLPAPRREDAIPLSSYVALAHGGQMERMKSLWRRHALMRVPSAAARACLDEMLADYQGRDLVAAQPTPLASIAGRLEDVYAPVLVVTGEQDTKWRQLVGDALAYGLPHGRRAIVPGAEHLCNLSHPDEYNILIAGFAARVENALAEKK
jgi:pimeloyl-ACP methyl ester carboxylesterase